MLVQIAGKVSKVVRRSYKRSDGTEAEAWDAVLTDDPQYRGKRISGPVDLLPAEGDEVTFRAVVKARAGKPWPYLSVWVVDRVAA